MRKTKTPQQRLEYWGICRSYTRQLKRHRWLLMLPLGDASDPALKALPSYKRQFRYHYQCGHAIYSRTLLKYETGERFLREQKVQEKALEIACGNLDRFYTMILQNYTDFVKHYSMQHRSHSNLLVNFGRDVEKLRSCKLIPLLQTGNRKCLLDFVKEENLRKMVEDCSSSHRQFENKVSEFKQEFSEIKRSIEHLFSSKTVVLIKDLELILKELQRFITEQKSIMQTLSKDVSTVKKLVDDYLSSQLSSSLRLHDAVSALGPVYDGHDKSYLPKMQTCERSITDLLDFCRNKKDEISHQHFLSPCTSFAEGCPNRCGNNFAISSGFPAAELAWP